MNCSDITELHFIAPIANVTSIVDKGILSHNLSLKIPHNSVAMQEIQDRRRNKQIPGTDKQLHDYANLYFDAHNPMLSKLRAKNSLICIVRASFDRWEGSFVDGDYFEFEANPNCTTLEMPVLFRYTTYRSTGASAYTVDHVNCLIDGTTVFTGNAYGPVVDYFDTGQSSDILMDYVKNLFQKANLTVFQTPDLPDSRPYHNNAGDIHCGTNVRRVIPSYTWWQ